MCCVQNCNHQRAHGGAAEGARAAGTLSSAVTFDLPDLLFYSGFRKEFAMAHLERETTRSHSQGAMVSVSGRDAVQALM